MVRLKTYRTTTLRLPTTKSEPAKQSCSDLDSCQKWSRLRQPLWRQPLSQASRFFPTRASCRPASVQEVPATCPYRLVPLHIARSDDPIELIGGGLSAVHSNEAALYRPVRDDQLTPAVGSGGSNLAPAHSGFHLLSQLAQPTGNFAKRFVPAGRLRSGGKPFSRLRFVRQLAASTDCARNTSTEEA
jgi:hypothetical protein